MSEIIEMIGTQLPHDWRILTINDLKSDEKYALSMGPFGSNIKAENFVKSGIPIIKGTNLNFYRFVGGDFSYLTEEKADELRSSNCAPLDLVFTHRGTIGQVGIVPKGQHDRYVVSQSGMKLAVNKSKVNPFFLLYFFKSRIGQHQLLKNESQVGVPSISTPLQSLKEVEVTVPPLPEQESIAELLSSLDDKIELLHRNNHTLDQIGETIFHRFFLDIQPSTNKLRDYVITANTGLDAIKRAPIVESETGLKCLRIQDVSQEKPLTKWGNTKVESNNFRKSQLKKNDIIMARTCSPGINYFVREDLPAVFNNGLVRIRANEEKVYPIFLYYLFKTRDFIGHIDGISGGTSVQLNMQVGDLLHYDFTFISKQKQDQLIEQFLDIDNKVLNNNKQIQNLAALRDALLPKLMTGELRVKQQAS